MIHLTADTKILVATQAVDFRKQIDSLVRLCHQELKQNPRSGIYFVFINRAKTMVRILSYDGTGYWLATKRLSQGRYHGWPSSDQSLHSLIAKQLSALLKSTPCHQG